MAIVLEWTSASANLTLKCQFCGTNYVANVSTMADGHGHLSSLVAQTKLEREKNKHLLQSPYPCPRCGKLDSGEADLRTKRLVKTIRKSILLGGIFGAFFLIVMAFGAVINQVQKDILELFAMIITWSIAVCTAILLAPDTGRIVFKNCSWYI